MKSFTLLGSISILALVETVTATDPSTCVSNGFMNCLDILGKCTDSSAFCADYCLVNSDCSFKCCYKNNCLIPTLCPDSNGNSTDFGNGSTSYSYSYSSSTTPIAAIIIPTIVGVSFFVGIVICCYRRQRAKTMMNQQQALQNKNKAAINNSYQQDMANQSMGMAQMNPFNTSLQPMMQPQQQPVYDYPPLQKGIPVSVQNQMYYQQRQQPQVSMQPQQQQQQSGNPQKELSSSQPEPKTLVVTYV